MHVVQLWHLGAKQSTSQSTSFWDCKQECIPSFPVIKHGENLIRMLGCHQALKGDACDERHQVLNAGVPCDIKMKDAQVRAVRWNLQHHWHVCLGSL